MRKFALIFLMCITAVGIVGCNKDKVEEQQAPVEPVKPIVYHAPLTGEVIKEEATNRVVTVMINNHTKARPQSGISQADMVYEILAEGDITRWLAVFQNELPNKMGPVRSAREYYIKLAAGYNGFYICHGNSPAAKELMDSGAIDSLNGIQYDGVYFHRDQTRVAPHNSYITKEDLTAAAEKLGIRMTDVVTPNSYSDEGIVADVLATDAPSVKINYSGNDNYKVLYTYDGTKNGYVRSQGGVNTTDRENDQTIVAQNVFIVKAAHNVVDNYGRRSIDLESGGQGYLLQKGKMLEITWENQDGRLVPMKDGVVVPFIPGQTWVNVVEDKESALTFGK